LLSKLPKNNCAIFGPFLATISNLFCRIAKTKTPYKMKNQAPMKQLRTEILNLMIQKHLFAIDPVQTYNQIQNLISTKYFEVEKEYILIQKDKPKAEPF